MVVECGIVEAVQTGCELSNNITILTELLVGGGLAIFFFVIQRRSSKMQDETWKENRRRVLERISVLFFVVSRNPDGLVEEGAINMSRNIVSEDKMYLKKEEYETVELFHRHIEQCYKDNRKPSLKYMKELQEKLGRLFKNP